jgi:diguanylate cyclase (GGDEF)-like protein
MKENTVEKILDVGQQTELTIEMIKNFAYEEESLQSFVKNKPEPYSNILFILVHRLYQEKTATSLWKKLVAHMAHLEKRLERKVGINVAAIDYLENIEPGDDSMGIIGEEALGNLREMTTKDELTELYTRDVFTVFIEKRFEEAARSGTRVSFALFDIDDFKAVNDTYGHSKGDEALKAVGRIILENIREMDMGIRYGGEELGVIFPRTDQATAGRISERIRDKIENFFRGETDVTISCGVSDNQGRKHAGDLVESADAALYRAKEGGKNQVCAA